VVVVTLCALSFAGGASAASPRPPTITPTEATFQVPPGATSAFVLRLWSHLPRSMVGSDEGKSGMLRVMVPATSDCAFQADVSIIGPGGSEYYYSGARATVPGCGPVSNLAGHIYLCSGAGAPTTTEVTGGTLSASGPQGLGPQSNPLAPTRVKPGTYTMSAGAPAGYVFVPCGGSSSVGSGATTATQPVTVPSGGTATGNFYVALKAPVGTLSGGSPPGGGSGQGPSTSPVVNHPESKSPAGTLAHASRPTPVASSQLAFTGQNTLLLLLVGLVALALGTLALVAAHLCRRALPAERSSFRSNE
jgi:hypothetical protein